MHCENIIVNAGRDVPTVFRSGKVSALMKYLVLLATSQGILGIKDHKFRRFKTHLCNHHSPKPGHVPMNVVHTVYNTL